MGQLLFGTALLASFLGGVVALLAPCCVSVTLPGYLATGFSRRSGIVAGTLVFAAGVATATSAGVMFAPGILLDGRPFGYGRPSERELRRTLQRTATHP